MEQDCERKPCKGGMTKAKEKAVSTSPDPPRTRTSVPGFGGPDKEACLSAPLQHLLQAAQWTICCQACLQKPQIPSLQGAEAGEASAYNKGNVLGGEGCQEDAWARPDQFRVHPDTQRVIHCGEPRGSKHWVPNATLPAPTQVLLSFAAGQILTFFHSASGGTKSKALTAVFLWEAEQAGRLAALGSSHPRWVKKSEPALESDAVLWPLFCLHFQAHVGLFSGSGCPAAARRHVWVERGGTGWLVCLWSSGLAPGNSVLALYSPKNSTVSSAIRRFLLGTRSPSCRQSAEPRALMREEMENNCLLLKEEDGRRERGPQSADSAPPLVLTFGMILGRVLPLCLSPHNQS